MWLSIICAGIAAHQVIKTKKPLFIIPFILNLSAASFFYYIDHNNIMVQYDRWIYRGMPEPYEASKQKPKSDIPKKLQEYSSSITMKRKKGEITDEEVTRMIDHYISEVDKIRAQKKAENKDQTTPSE